jgi:hypothetical protein
MGCAVADVAKIMAARHGAPHSNERPTALIASVNLAARTSVGTISGNGAGANRVIDVPSLPANSVAYERLCRPLGRCRTAGPLGRDNRDLNCRSLLRTESSGVGLWSTHLSQRLGTMRTSKRIGERWFGASGGARRRGCARSRGTPVRLRTPRHAALHAIQHLGTCERTIFCGRSSVLDCQDSRTKPKHETLLCWVSRIRPMPNGSGTCKSSKMALRFWKAITRANSANDWRMESTRKFVLSPGWQAVFTRPSRH